VNDENLSENPSSWQASAAGASLCLPRGCRYRFCSAPDRRKYLMIWSLELGNPPTYTAPLLSLPRSIRIGTQGLWIRMGQATIPHRLLLMLLLLQYSQTRQSRLNLPHRRPEIRLNNFTVTFTSHFSPVNAGRSHSDAHSSATEVH
jgi:hypothetical protein